MSVTFHIYEENNSSKKDTVELELKHSILDLKKYIVDKFKIELFIDLILKIEKPIRGFGKMNLERGMFPRTMDSFLLSNYNIEGIEIPCEFIVVDNYLPNISKESNGNKSNNPSNIYCPPGSNPPGSNPPGSNVKDKKKVEPEFNIESESDFPSL
jgi:hypothetical protein